MWLRRFTRYLLTHRFKAVLFTFLITLLPFLLAFYLPNVANNLRFFLPCISTIGILFATFVTLVEGTVKGAVFTTIATLPLVIFFFLAGGYGYGMINPILLAFVASGVLSNILIWFFAAMLHRGTTWSDVLQIAALLGVLIVSLIHLIYPQIGAWWRQVLSFDTQGNTLSSVALKNSLAQAGQLPPKIISFLSQILTGLIVVAILSAAIIQLVIARWWQAFVYSPGSLRAELHNIRLSRLAGILFLLCLFLFAVTYNRVVPDILPIIFTLFLAAGLSVIHYFVGLKPTPFAYAFLVVLYILLLFLPVMPIVFLMIFALLDIWLDLRNKIKLT